MKNQKKVSTSCDLPISTATTVIKSHFNRNLTDFHNLMETKSQFRTDKEGRKTKWSLKTTQYLH